MIEEASCVFLDVRNFTNLLAENTHNESFYSLIERIYDEGLIISKKLSGSKKYYINSTGDGFLVLFFGEYHHVIAYLFSLIIQTRLPKVFESVFNIKKEEGDYWFGIGIESGQVRQVKANYEGDSISTYLGNVINIAARIESLTKDHARAPILFGPSLNENLVSTLYGYSYLDLMNTAKKEKDRVQAKRMHMQMSDINTKLMSSYIFEHRIKGVKDPIPIFRISPTLVNFDSCDFKSLLELFPKELSGKVVNMLNE